MAAAPRIADMIGGQGQLPKTEPANVSFWDEAAETLARADTVNSISPLLKSGVTGAI